MSKKHHACPFQKGTFLYNDFLTSKAFISLTKHGKTILLMLYLKRQMPGKMKTRKHLPQNTVINNGELQLTYKELHSFGLSDKTITRAFDDVIRKGFVRVEYLGGKGKLDNNLYSVIEDWRLYGTDSFAPREREKSVKYGFCASVKN